MRPGFGDKKLRPLQAKIKYQSAFYIFLLEEVAIFCYRNRVANKIFSFAHLYYIVLLVQKHLQTFFQKNKYDRFFYLLNWEHIRQIIWFLIRFGFFFNCITKAVLRCGCHIDSRVTIKTLISKSSMHSVLFLSLSKQICVLETFSKSTWFHKQS